MNPAWRRWAPRAERFSVKFYMVGMIFILFDIEAVFLYPWAVVYRQLKIVRLLRDAGFRGADPGGLLLRVEEGRAGLVRAEQVPEDIVRGRSPE